MRWRYHNWYSLAGRNLSQVPQPLLQGICSIKWPHSITTAPLVDAGRSRVQLSVVTEKLNVVTDGVGES